MLTAEDIENANRLLPDYVGFIRAPGLRRTKTPEEVRRLTERLDGRIIPVGVYINESPDRVIREVCECGLGAVQLHGDEDDGYIRELKQQLSCPVIKAFRIRSEEDVRKAEACAANLVLLDSGAGTGKSFDHSLLGFLTRDYILAGGLNPENVGELISRFHPYGVDTSSGIETGGRKDPAKMAAFTDAVRQEDRKA